jgi:plasmid stabilization system protein ParE
MYSLEFDPKAIEEIEHSLGWYLEKSIAAAEGFRAELDEVTNAVCRDPYVWPSYEVGLREILMDRYPYTVVFSIFEETHAVVIISIFHQSRHPRGKYGSTPLKPGL